MLKCVCVCVCVCAFVCMCVCGSVHTMYYSNRFGVCDRVTSYSTIGIKYMEKQGESLCKNGLLIKFTIAPRRFVQPRSTTASLVEARCVSYVCTYMYSV